MDSILDFISEDYRPEPEITTPALQPVLPGIDEAFKQASKASVAAFDAALARNSSMKPKLPNTVKMEEPDEETMEDQQVKRSLSEPPLLARSGSPSSGDAGDDALHAITTVTVKQDPQATTHGSGLGTAFHGGNDVEDRKQGYATADGASGLNGSIPGAVVDGGASAIAEGAADNNANAGGLVGPQQIQAYAKLEFSFLNFYIQKLSVTIGRRPPPPPGAVAAAAIIKQLDEEAGILQPFDLDGLTSLRTKPEGNDYGETPIKAEAGSLAQADAPIAGSSKDAITEEQQQQFAMSAAEIERWAGNKVHVDVDLGPIKAVSRDHARLFFDSDIDPRTNSSNGWSIEVKGRNGLVLDGSWKAKGEIVRLNNGSKIQIAERVFYFRLPYGVEYPTVPQSPVQDEEFDNQMPGYDDNALEQDSPIIYGSDSDELRSDDDSAVPAAKVTSSKRRAASPDSASGDNDPSYTGKGGPRLKSGGRKKRGRPPKAKTADQLAAEEAERLRKLDPNAPKKTRGRPPKKEPSKLGEGQASQEGDLLTATPANISIPQALPGEEAVAAAPAPASTSVAEDLNTPLNAIPEANLTKKQISEMKKLEREKAKEEKARQKDLEKAEKEAAKQAKKEQKQREDAEKKRKLEAEKGKAKAPMNVKSAMAVPPTNGHATGLALPSQAAPPQLAAQQQASQAPIYASAQPIIPASTQQQGYGQPGTSQPQPQPPKRATPKPQPMAPARAAPPPAVATNQFQFKPDKPPYSYAALIAQAIYSTPSKQANLQYIHAWIPDHYPYFKAHFGVLQAAIKQNLAVNRTFVNIPLANGIALWAVEPEQAKYFDGNTFLTPPPTTTATAPLAAVGRTASPSVPPQSYPSHLHTGVSPSMSPAAVHAPTPAYQAVQAVPTPAPAAAPTKVPIIIATLPPSYQKPPQPLSTSDPSSMLDPHGFPPIAIHENKMFLSPSVFATLTAVQLSNLQAIETKQALTILQAFVVNYFKQELKKKKKAEKAAAAAAAASMSPAPGGAKRPADQALEGMGKVQKVS